MLCSNLHASVLLKSSTASERFCWESEDMIFNHFLGVCVEYRLKTRALWGGDGPANLAR